MRVCVRCSCPVVDEGAVFPILESSEARRPSGDEGDRVTAGSDVAPLTPLVVSRFAVRIAQQAARPDDDWMRYRAALLRRFTLPSLERSGWAGLRWALLVDPELYEPARHVLEPALEQCRNTRPILVRVEGEPFSRTAVPEDLARLGLTTDRVVSLRLDTDDVLLPGTVARVVKIAGSVSGPAMIDLYSGYQYDARSGRMRTHAKGMQGPFVAVVNDRRANPIDAAEFHPTARHGREVRFAHGRSFIQVVHGGNVYNSIKRRPFRSRVLSPLRHNRDGGGVRRAWTLAVANREVGPSKAAAVLQSCGIDPGSPLPQLDAFSRAARRER
jgi:hypothetical protein